MKGGKFFLDSNIVVYALHPESSTKQEIAEDLMDKAERGEGCISFQVVQEVINLALKKFRPVPSIADVRQMTKDILLPICKAIPNPAFYLEALDTHHLTRLSWYDCLILQAAVETGCRTLYSEDFQNGFQYRGVTVVNPFK